MGLFDWLKKKPATKTNRPAALLQGNFDPGANAVQIQYKNYLGEMKSFTVDGRGAYKKGKHFVVRAAPTGRKIALKLSSIQNFSDVETHLENNPQPDADERKILNFHLKRGSSSPLFVELQRKYPDYQP